MLWGSNPSEEGGFAYCYFPRPQQSLPYQSHLTLTGSLAGLRPYLTDNPSFFNRQFLAPRSELTLKGGVIREQRFFGNSSFEVGNKLASAFRTGGHGGPPLPLHPYADVSGGHGVTPISPRRRRRNAERRCTSRAKALTTRLQSHIHHTISAHYVFCAQVCGRVRSGNRLARRA